MIYLKENVNQEPEKQLFFLFYELRLYSKVTFKSMRVADSTFKRNREREWLKYGLINPYAAGGYFGRYKMIQKSWKMTETLANGYSSESTHQELSNEYQHDMVSMIFEEIYILMLWTKVASALEGLTRYKHVRQHVCSRCE